MFPNKHIRFLKNYKLNILEEYKRTTLKNDLMKSKKELIACDDQEKAKLIWCVETMYDIQYLYIKVWNELKKKNFYEA